MRLTHCWYSLIPRLFSWRKSAWLWDHSWYTILTFILQQCNNRGQCSCNVGFNGTTCQTTITGPGMSTRVGTCVSSWAYSQACRLGVRQSQRLQIVFHESFLFFKLLCTQYSLLCDKNMLGCGSIIILAPDLRFMVLGNLVHRCECEWVCYKQWWVCTHMYRHGGILYMQL